MTACSYEISLWVLKSEQQTSEISFNTWREILYLHAAMKYSQLSLRWTPLGPALSVCLREVSIL